jgi:catechol 2,3-dioxygenase-like lactoylglutathione lyase family enzyme
MTAQPSSGVIGQVSRQVSDIPRAVDWYKNVLGLPHLYTFGDLACFEDLDGQLPALMSQVTPA